MVYDNVDIITFAQFRILINKYYLRDLPMTQNEQQTEL
jgi:hypothetical protein